MAHSTPSASASVDTDVIVQADNLGKCYRIYDRPQDRLKQTLFQNRRQYFREFWALRHVDFQLRRGETLGIIGRNGSGKSTLLQLLCGTLTPTEGSRHIHGRVAALLELGSGFNPEFTGLENVYLYASLLGLRREETEARLDAILGFADIGEFAKQPVKTYSSGMAVRLAFAVIANVDADVLVVDEALSVGDVFFVQKCMRFIKKFKEQNTLILVTHDSQAALTVCSHGLVLANGRMITKKITAKRAIQAYVDHFYLRTAGAEAAVSVDEDGLQQGELPVAIDQEGREDMQPSRQERTASSGSSSDPADQPELHTHNGRSAAESAAYAASLQSAVEQLLASGRTLFTSLEATEESGEYANGECYITSIMIANRDPAKSAMLAEGETVEVRIEARCVVDIVMPVVGFAIRNRDGLPILGENTFSCGRSAPSIAHAGETIAARFTFTMPRISPGQYTVNAAIARGTLEEHTQLHYLHEACAFDVVSSRPCNALSCPSDMMVEVL